MKTRTAQICGLATLSFILLMAFTPAIPQPQLYHDFADKRTFFGIPNTLNVVSNFPFLVFGLIGLALCYIGNNFELRLRGERFGWTCFFASVAAVGIGSSYYHLKPNHSRLLWDRLPMTLAFTSILGTCIIERIDAQKGTMSFTPLLLAGVVTNLYWRLSNDIRPYVLIQLAPCIAVPVMALVLSPMYTHSTYWLLASAFYPLAMLGEMMDRVIYTLTFHIVSGHTLKHLSAAMFPLIMILMLLQRTYTAERIRPEETRKETRKVS